MENYKLKEVMLFDTETTGLPKKGQKWDKDFLEFPHLVQIAWEFNGKEKSYIIRPNGWIIPKEVSEIHGITTTIANRDGVSLEKVIEEFLQDAKSAPLICAHNIYFDTSILKANILRTFGKKYYDDNAEDALFKGKRIDTMRRSMKLVNAKNKNGGLKFPTLAELHTKLFNKEFKAHNALEDVRALKKMLRLFG